MSDYSQGKIYKLVCEESGKVYYGSTIQTLPQRLAQHKNHKNCMSKTMTNPKIYLVENYPCESKWELEERERYYIKNNECINITIPHRTNKEYREDNKEHNAIIKKEYYQNVTKNNPKQMEDRKKNKKAYREKKYMYKCECGSVILRETKERHFRTKKHQSFLAY